MKRSFSETNLQAGNSALRSYFVTVSPGLEFLAEEELKEKLSPAVVKAVERSGKVFFATDKRLEDILLLRSADSLYAFVSETYGIPSDAAGLQVLQKIPLEVDWEPALDLWKEAFRLQADEADPAQVAAAEAVVSADPLAPKFRVSGKRSGMHTFKSPEMAGHVGAGLIAKYGKWSVDLKHWQLEVYSELTSDCLVLGVSLTKEPLYNRNRSALIITSLKPSIAYCMARLARLQPGEVVIDPMMGIGTIPIEASLVWRDSCYLGGDIAKSCVDKAVQNVREAKARVDILQWDVAKLPLSSGCVDVTLSDIPFGVKSGSNKHNQKLYPRLFREMTRITKTNGRAIILTLEKNFIKRILTDNHYWQQTAYHPVEMGGLEVAIFVLQRTAVQVTDRRSAGSAKSPVGERSLAAAASAASAADDKQAQIRRRMSV